MSGSNRNERLFLLGARGQQQTEKLVDLGVVFRQLERAPYALFRSRIISRLEQEHAQVV
jgi:hypothetical protein